LRRAEISEERIVKAILTCAFCLLLPAAAQAQATDPVTARLSAERTGAITPGLYSAGEGREFTLSSYRGKFLLRFANMPESFVLTADAGSMGAKLLKYDTGGAALSVSVWGGVTLYLAEAPNGLPATLQGTAPPPIPQPVSVAELRTALSDEAAHFSYSDDLVLRFIADARTLSDADARAMAFDALANVQMGLERFVAVPNGRRALSRRISTVKLERGNKPGLILSGRNLVVRYTPSEGFLGRLSSHAVAHQLGKLLSVQTPE
jgi:hypothetical protein